MRKKKIHRDIYQILSSSGVPSQYWEKILTKLTNYTYNEVMRVDIKPREKEMKCLNPTN
jgi:hypothetical protein